MNSFASCLVVPILLVFVSASTNVATEAMKEQGSDEMKFLVQQLLDRVDQLTAEVEDSKDLIRSQQQVINHVQAELQKQVFHSNYQLKLTAEVENNKDQIRSQQTSISNLAAQANMQRDVNMKHHQAVKAELKDMKLNIANFASRSVKNAAEFVGFSAYVTDDTEYPSGASPIKFEGVEYNSGANYNPELSSFYCPVNGIYFFSVTVSCAACDFNLIRASEVVATINTGDHGEAATGYRYSGAQVVIIECNAGDLVYVAARAPSELAGDLRESTFTGFLLASAVQ